uniref:Mitochondrial S-adenosylmethionine carrier protein n=1 Tax=Callorhinchus milii TaxID=7868 RepID=A0A4W3HX10_CALMI
MSAPWQEPVSSVSSASSLPRVSVTVSGERECERGAMQLRDPRKSFVAGGVAGICVDLILFPLDTIKTRLQSSQGFSKTGGFRGIYAGVPSAAIGSFPSAAAFFVSYECIKSALEPHSSPKTAPLVQMVGASVGEVVGCLIRVPTELVKQRTQACPTSSSYKIFLETVKQEGFFGLYRGYGSTVLREIPFSLIQLPLWESLKVLWSRKQNHVVNSWQSAVCGAFAGGVAGAITTPLDVAKTRIMLARANILLSFSCLDENTWISWVTFLWWQKRSHELPTGRYHGGGWKCAGRLEEHLEG